MNNPYTKAGDTQGDSPITPHGGSVSDVAYAASWDTVTTIAPSKNAVYDKIETLAPLSHTHTLTDITDEGALASLNTVGTTQIDDDAVTYAKMQNVSAQNRFLGRKSVGAGNPEEISLGASLELSGGGALQRAALTGDVTASAGSNTTAISPSVITTAARTVLDDATVEAMVNTLGGAASTGSGGLARATSPELVTPTLGTPASGVLTNCTGLPVASIVGGTLTGKINLGEGQEAIPIGIEIDAWMVATDLYSGITIPGTAGATLAFGNLCYFNSSMRWVLADADVVSLSGPVMLGICVDASTDTNPTSMLLMGTVRADAVFPQPFTVGTIYYVSGTPGGITTTQPSGVANVIRVIGWAVASQTIYFNPSSDWITHV